MKTSKYYQICPSMPLHYLFPMFTGIKSSILWFGSNGSRVEQYLCTLKNHSSCCLWKPLIPANGCHDTIDANASGKHSYTTNFSINSSSILTNETSFKMLLMIKSLTSDMPQQRSTYTALSCTYTPLSCTYAQHSQT